MPISRSYSRSGSGHFRPQPKTHPDPKTARKIAIRELFISSDCQNTADLGLFLNGARYGLLFDRETGNRRADWARIRYGLEEGFKELNPYPG
jgi:hypothetical protein